MARDGSGNYNLPAGQPVVTGTTISSSVHNALASDVAAALTQSLSKDGQTTPSANLPMGTFKHTGVGDATLRTQYTSAGQTQDRGMSTIGSVAGTNTITGTLAPSITAYANGMLLGFEPAVTNTGAATINLNSVGARDIRKGNNTALVAGDLVAGAFALVIYDLGSTVFLLLNPQTGVGGTSLFADGSLGAPSISFTSDPDTGIRRNAANDLRLVVGGVDTLELTSLFINSRIAHFFSDGSAAAPAISFGLDQDTGIYNVAADRIGFATGGVLRAFTGVGFFQLEPTTLFYAADGSAALPGISFASDADTGFYSSGVNELSYALGGAQRFRMLVGELGMFMPTATNTYLRLSQVGFADWVIGMAASSTNIDFQNASVVRFTVTTEQAAGRDGSAATPGLTFLGDLDTGIYRAGANDLGLTTGGVRRLQITDGAVSAEAQFQVLDGSPGIPGLGFSSDTNTGLTRTGSGFVEFISDGAGVGGWTSLASGSMLVAQADGTATHAVGYRDVPQNSQSGNYTLVASDRAKHILHPSGAGAGDTFTIPSNASVAYPTGTVISFVNGDSNSLAIAITTDTMTLAGTTTTGTRTLAQNGVATAIKIGSTSWIISGTGLS